MTNSPFGGISLDGILSDILTGKSDFPGMFTSTTVTTETPVAKDAPKYKKVSEIGVGTAVVTPEGEVLTVTNLALVTDGLVELVFSDGDNMEVWLNAMLEVK